jgi:predicted nicotinamide N-methyase
VWDSSIVFAKYMEHNPQLFCSSDISGKTLLELGSGCGLAGLSFMVKGAEVTLTDLPHIVEELTGPNAEVMIFFSSPVS